MSTALEDILALMTRITSLRISAALLLLGQLLYIVVTLLHTGGEANHHRSVFAGYAASPIWAAVHVGQLVAMTVMLGGLLALFHAVDLRDEMAKWMARAGAVVTAAALGLYAVLQAVDGIALKHAVSAWVTAPAAEKPARFAAAEAIRWLEWGTRSYHDYALGFALLLFAVAVLRTQWIPRAIPLVMALSGLAYLLQGWILGVEGFSHRLEMGIVVAYVLGLTWMVWMAGAAWRMREAEVSPGATGLEVPASE